MNAFKRSWEITKLSYDVMKKDKELFLFPVLGGIFSLLFLIAMIYPFFIAVVPAETTTGMFWLLIFLVYLGLAFIATFFNVATVYTIKTRFDGKNATFWGSIGFSFSKIHLILAWSMISAIIGLILRILENIAERMGGIGEILMRILLSLIGLAWSLLTAFVIPGMVYRNIGPIAAVKESVHTFKKTWGESLIRHYGLGMAQLVFIIVGVISTIVLLFLTAGIPIITYILVALGIIYVIAVIAFFSIANSVFNTTLYVYATTGKAPKGYEEDVLKHAFERKKKKEF